MNEPKIIAIPWLKNVPIPTPIRIFSGEFRNAELKTNNCVLCPISDNSINEKDVKNSYMFTSQNKYDILDMRY